MWASATAADLATLLRDVSPAASCRAFFLAATAGVVAAQLVPKRARHLLNDYGPRSSSSSSSSSSPSPVTGTGNQIGQTKTGSSAQEAGSWFYGLLGRATSIGQVPHAWFFHFYVAYLIAAAFWSSQLVYGGAVLRGIAHRQLVSGGGGASMTGTQVIVVGVMMRMQALRRLYECLIVMKPSSSRMWIVHWLLALLFYLAMSVATWIEAPIPMLRRHWETDLNDLLSARLALPIVVFLLASYQQHKCHRYLAALTKYSLPEKGLFRWLICPHYSCECLIYLSLAAAGAPPGQLVNVTLLSAAMFVFVNLGATAIGTRDWYYRKFGPERLRGKSRIIPFLF